MSTQLNIHQTKNAFHAEAHHFDTFSTITIVAKTEAHPAAQRFLRNETQVVWFFDHGSKEREYIDALVSSINSLADIMEPHIEEDGEDYDEDDKD